MQKNYVLQSEHFLFYDELRCFFLYSTILVQSKCLYSLICYTLLVFSHCIKVYCPLQSSSPWQQPHLLHDNLKLIIYKTNNLINYTDIALKESLRHFSQIVPRNVLTNIFINICLSMTMRFLARYPSLVSKSVTIIVLRHPIIFISTFYSNIRLLLPRIFLHCLSFTWNTSNVFKNNNLPFFGDHMSVYFDWD